MGYQQFESARTGPRRTRNKPAERALPEFQNVHNLVLDVELDHSFLLLA
jgi:hypothetical protein